MIVVIAGTYLTYLGSEKKKLVNQKEGELAA